MKDVVVVPKSQTRTNYQTLETKYNEQIILLVTCDKHHIKCCYVTRLQESSIINILHEPQDKHSEIVSNCFVHTS